MTPPQILSGLREIASDYDALVCDVWGVLHDGHTGNQKAVAALREFRDSRSATSRPCSSGSIFHRIAMTRL